MSGWFSDAQNIAFLALAIPVAFAALRVVTTNNVVHAALYLVLTLAGTAGLFLLLSAEFVAWTLVLVYIGAVVVLFLFGIMITRAPTGFDPGLNNPNRLSAAVVSAALFGVLSWSANLAFEDVALRDVGSRTPTELLGEAILGRFVLPFEVVSIVLLAALIGGITIARRDASPAEAEERLGRPIR